MKLKMLFLLLLNGSMFAMGDPGIWDEQGNYRGPARFGAILYLPFYDDGTSLIAMAQMHEHKPIADGCMVQTIVHNHMVPDNSAHEETVNASGVLEQEIPSAQQATTSAAPAVSKQQSKTSWADVDSDDDTPASLPEGWIAYAQQASASSTHRSASMSYAAAAQKQLMVGGKPPRMLRKSDVVSPSADHAVVAHKQDNRPAPLRILKQSEVRAPQTEHVVSQVVGAESANWREPVSFDDRLALAARNGRDNRQQFMVLLETKIYWLLGSYERKIAKESAKLLYILDQNVQDDALNPHDTKALLRLANKCINYGVRRAQRKENKKGYVHVAQRLLFLALPLLDDIQREKVQEIYNKIDSMQFEREEIC